ncbi:MAG: TonB-dependent receptor [Acidobacteria bacterium]|nr:TonB-dependent receptor [Acidobacteriota bacterium]
MSARKSYLHYLIDVLSEYEDDIEGVAIDFTDALGKAVYDLTPQHQIGINVILGRSDFKPSDSRRIFDPDEIARANSWISLFHAQWNYNAGPRFTSQTRIFSVSGDYKNADLNRLPLQEGEVRQAGVRTDINFAARPEHHIEAGIYLRALRGSGTEIKYFPPPPVYSFYFDRSSNQQGYYLQDTWSSKQFSLALTGGARIDHFGLTSETLVTPRVALSFAPRESTRIRLGWGQYGDFPDFGHLFGSHGNPDLHAERSTHYNVSIEHLISNNTRIVVEAYDREDKNLLFSLNEPLIQNGQLAFLNFPFRNSIKGYGRGFELSFHRRSANRLTGWLAYSFSTTRLRDQVAGLSFVSDHDQRHTISAYGSYRLTNTFNLSGQWRYGSGLPMVGFFREVDGRQIIGSERNTVRLPDYSRLDLRVNKAFYFKRSKLTLSGEVINVFARDNFRQENRRRERLLPFLPSIGVAFEF